MFCEQVSYWLLLSCEAHGGKTQSRVAVPFLSHLSNVIRGFHRVEISSTLYMAYVEGRLTEDDHGMLSKICKLISKILNEQEAQH